MMRRDPRGKKASFDTAKAAHMARQGKTRREIADALGVRYGTMSAWLRDNKIAVQPHVWETARIPVSADEVKARLIRAKAVQALIKQGATIAVIMAETGSNTAEIAMQRLLLKAAGVEVTENRGRVGRRRRATKTGDMNGIDIVDAFTINHSPQAMKYWGERDE